MELLILTILFIYSILYFYLFARIQNLYFKNLSHPTKNNAILIVFISSIASASINLIHISDITSEALRYFIKNSDFMMGLFYSFCYMLGMWIFSILLFRISYIIVGLLTPEKEEDELMKNNIELSLLHSIILISLSFILAPSLILIASSFIPYPKIVF